MLLLLVILNKARAFLFKEFIMTIIIKQMLAVAALSAMVSFAQADTLYDDLGGQQGVANIVDDFITEISFDKNIYPFFKNTDIERLRIKLQEQFCMVSNGPCEYTGDTMEAVHAGMQIDKSQFNRVVELLQNAMTSQGVSYADQNRLIQRLAPMRPAIIHR